MPAKQKKSSRAIESDESDRPRIGPTTLDARTRELIDRCRLTPHQASLARQIMQPTGRRQPRKATNQPAGTHGKVSVMVERAAAGRKLFHPDDAGSARHGLGFVLVIELIGAFQQTALMNAKAVLGLRSDESLPPGASVESVPLPEPVRQADDDDDW